MIHVYDESPLIVLYSERGQTAIIVNVYFGITFCQNYIIIIITATSRPQYLESGIIQDYGLTWQD